MTLENSNSWLAAYAGPITLVLLLMVALLASLGVWLASRMRRLERHYASLLRGTYGGTLEAVLDDHMDEFRNAMGCLRDVNERISQLELAARSHVRHVGLLRYNPFRETGGDQSFVLTMADSEGNGAIVTSLHNREATRMYAKPLSGWKSTYPLTDEEIESLRRARTEK